MGRLEEYLLRYPRKIQENTRESVDEAGAQTLSLDIDENALSMSSCAKTNSPLETICCSMR